MSLLEQTQSLLTASLASGLSLKDVADESSGEVVYEWLKKFSAGKIEDPGVTRVEALHRCLSRIQQRTLDA